MRTKRPTYRKADGSYERSVVVGHKPDGSPDRHYARGRTKAEMNANYDELKASVVRGDVIKKNKLTVHEYATQWFNATQEPANAATYRMYRRIVKHIGDKMPGILLREVTEMHVVAAKNALVDKAGQPLTTTRKQFILTLRQVFHQAVKEHKMRDNVAEDVNASYISEPRRPISSDEWDAFESADLSSLDRLLACLPLWIGVRKQEAIALRPVDLDSQTSRIRISRAWYVDSQYKPQIKDLPKTQEGFREIKAPEPLLAVWKSATAGMAPNELIFKTEQGTIWTEKTFTKHWNHVKNQVNITLGGRNAHGTGQTGVKVERIQVLRETVKYHELRHTYCTALYYAGVPLLQAQYLMGHADSKMTADVYTHLDKASFVNPYPKQTKTLKDTFINRLKLVQHGARSAKITKISNS